LKNSALTAFVYAIIWVLQRHAFTFFSVSVLVLVFFGAITATAALWAQWTHHFGRQFRKRVGEALYPELAFHPIINERLADSDPRLNGRKGIRFAKHFAVPRSLNAYIERTLMFLFAYGLVAILGLTVFVSTKEVATKLLTYLTL
jgi:hypothetical protein